MTRDGFACSPLYFADGGIRRFFKGFKNFANLSNRHDPNIFLVNDRSDPINLSKSSMNFEGNRETDNNFNMMMSQPNNLFQVASKFFQSVVSNIPKSNRKNGNQQNGIPDISPAGQESALAANYDIGSFELIDDENRVVLDSSAQHTFRMKPLTLEEWNSFKDQHDRITNITEVKKRIFFGGIEPSLRKVVWKYLLDYYPTEKQSSSSSSSSSIDSNKDVVLYWDVSNQKTQNIRLNHVKNYRLLSNQWRNLLPEQEANWSKLLESKSDINKDVRRTDRHLKEFAEESSKNLVLLSDILLSYCFYNWDIGYGQGMNDLLSPLILIMEDEVEAFWCFKGLMTKMKRFFHKDLMAPAIATELLKLQKLLNFVDPNLYNRLRVIDVNSKFDPSEEKIFTLHIFVRHLLTLFKREFSLEKTMIMWDLLFSNYLHKDYHLFIILALLVNNRECLMKDVNTFDEVLLFFNNKAENMDDEFEKLLDKSYQLYELFISNTDDNLKETLFQ
eukprot:TRINITY_DN1084_c3_g1_i1.p1 TRINITY_DN1084_c3_g1~~TRINITY_DN1084_c3_g1_i1.p1  ORF type:complete len:502 (-),score=131.85 TRINITY_DN1084_c3_g1_i1:253-1758(-)